MLKFILVLFIVLSESPIEIEISLKFDKFYLTLGIKPKISEKTELDR